MDNERIVEVLHVQALGNFPELAETRIEWHAAEAITKLAAELDAALTVIAEAEVISRGPWPFAQHTAARVEQLRAILTAGPSTARDSLAGAAAASVLEAFADRMANSIYLETGGSAHHEAFNRAHLDAASLARAEATRIREQAGRPEHEGDSKSTLSLVAAAIDSSEALDANATLNAVRKILHDAGVPASTRTSAAVRKILQDASYPHRPA